MKPLSYLRWSAAPIKNIQGVFIMNLNLLTQMSNHYGSDDNYVLAGGGNTSYKQDGLMYVKGSGTSLASITAEQFVAMDVAGLLNIMDKEYPCGISDDEREEIALSDMMAAKLPGQEHKRPSVEAILHAIFPYTFVLHTHPALVNGLTCGKDGKAKCAELFGKSAVWVELTKPGLILSQKCNKLFREYAKSEGKCPQIVILENHGIFVAADTVDEIDSLMKTVMQKLYDAVTIMPNFDDVFFDAELVCSISPALRMLFSPDGMANVVFKTNKDVMRFVKDSKAFMTLAKPFSPDHIVYCKDEPLYLSSSDDIASAFSSYADRKGFKPKIVAVEGLGFFSLGASMKDAVGAQTLFLDAVKIGVYTDSFGGTKHLPDEFTEFILNWEVEQYRTKISSASSSGGRLAGKVAIVTGGAQGFGKGISEAMALQGAYICVADLNLEGAKACADELNARFGANRAIAVPVDVSDENAVKQMVCETVLAFGGLDVLVSNAGVLIAGGVSDMTKDKFDFVTKINYSGYFLCTKYAVEPMKIQNKYAPGYMMDIIEINSKSGLEGSNKNFAYAGSKFGGIGLTQSFALELVGYGIKVNAICPGNLLDGPLWSDPEKGLFRQYLDSGKVAGAKTLDDVRKFYEAKVPLGRGCTTEDVAKAIVYAIEQKYETGQAIPVTGGQVMLS